MANRDILTVLGQRIARHRADQSITQVDLAKVIGMSRGSVANIEAGRQEPGIGTLVVIATTFGVSIDSLITERPTEVDQSAWLELAKRNTTSERTYERLADDCWRNHDVMTAVRYRGMAEGLKVARDNHLSIVRDMRADVSEVQL